MANKTDERKPIVCSFCGKRHGQVRKLISGPEGIFICNECVELCAELIEEEIEKVAENPLPAVILIPGVSGNTGKGLSAVKKSVEQAVGSDILFGDE